MGLTQLWEMENREYRKILMDGTDYTGEIVNIDIVDNIDDSIENKIINLSKVYKSIDYDLEVLNNEIKRLKGIKELAQRNKDQLKDYIQFAFLTLDKKVIEDPTIKITLRNNPSKLVIEDENSVPQKYRNVKTTFTIDKKQLKEDIENGTEIDGCYLMKDQTIMVK
jgi:hypothetical protein